MKEAKRIDFNQFFSILYLYFVLLNFHEIRSRSAESFGMIHFFGFCGRHDELSRRCCARNVCVIINAFPEQRGKGFGAFVTEVLMLEPISAANNNNRDRNFGCRYSMTDVFLARVCRNRFGDGEFGI